MTSPRLSDFAAIHIGYKSLLNDFFYVDQERRERFEIEEEYLTPIYKLADLDVGSYVQTGLTPGRWVFNCKVEPSDLKGTGAWKYVKWGAQQETRPRKQTEKPVPWPKAPALSHARHWYWPAAVPRLSRIAIRKAIGQRYAPFLFDEPALLDQRLYVVVPRGGVEWELVAAYLSSSLFPLSLEVGANLSLGVGYLTLGTNAFRRLPSLDLRALAKSPHKPKILDAASELFASEPMNASDYPTSERIRKLDAAFLGFAGVPEGRADALGAEVARFAQLRRDLELLKEEAPGASSAADVSAVAQRVADDLQPWLDARRFPEDFIDDTARLPLSIPAPSLLVTADPVLGQCRLQVVDDTGDVHFEADLPDTVAEVVLRALQMGRREFEVPLDPDAAHRTLEQLDQLLEEFETRFQQALAQTSLGRKYEGEVRSAVLKKVAVPLFDLRSPFGHGTWEVERHPVVTRT